MSRTVIQLALPFAEDTGPRPRWKVYGFELNPFPGSGVATAVDYNEHQVDQIRRINEWLNESIDGKKSQFGPLLIKGTIGVGKTHILRRIERVVETFGQKAYPGKIGVSYHTVAGSGARNLAFSQVLQEALMAPVPGRDDLDSGAELPLLSGIFSELHSEGSLSAESPLYGLPRTSPLRAPIGKVIAAKPGSEMRTELERDLTSWLMRRELPKSALGRIGASGRIEGEGEAVRAYAHVFRLARRVLGFRAWILLIDQIEDLWRSSEVTPVKRARFLTDLRTHIDECLEGAPVPPILAWNTDVISAGRLSSTNVEEKLESDYLALFARLPKPIDLPMLPIADHAFNFAKNYVDAGGGNGKQAMLDELQNDLGSILDGIQMRADTRIGELVNQRAWLKALRVWADSPIDSNVDRPVATPRGVTFVVRTGRRARAPNAK